MYVKSKKVIDQILYGDGVYVSALPCLVMAAISDVFDNLIARLIRRSDHCS